METPETLSARIAALARDELGEMFSPEEAWAFSRETLRSMSQEPPEGLDRIGVMLEIHNDHAEAAFFGAISLQFMVADEDGEHDGMAMVTVGFQYPMPLESTESVADGWVQDLGLDELIKHIESSVVYGAMASAGRPTNTTIDGFEV